MEAHEKGFFTEEDSVAVVTGAGRRGGPHLQERESIGEQGIGGARRELALLDGLDAGHVRVRAAVLIL